MSEQKSAGMVVHAGEPGGLAMVLTPTEAEARLRELQDFVARNMVEGTDYGKIPGTDKDTLLQPGAQKLAEIYGFAVTFEDERPPIERWEGDPMFAYFKRARVTRRRDGLFLGSGVGSCNSREKKYAGRWVFEREVPADLDMARLPQKSGKAKTNGKPYTLYRVPNPEIFDLVNTIEKMACKRALVHAVIAVTRSAGIFTQDMEDIGTEARGDKVHEGTFEDAPEASAAPPPATRSPRSPASPLDAARARWREGSATIDDESALAASPDERDRGMVFSWLVREALTADAVDAVAKEIARDQHKAMREALLLEAEQRKVELALPAQGAA